MSTAWRRWCCGLARCSDARAQVRTRAATLAQRIERASLRTALDDASRAHLKDSAESLRAVLAAPLQRAGG